MPIPMRVAGAWLALAAIDLAIALVFHRPVTSDNDVQMQRIADRSLRWAVVHGAGTVVLSFFAIASLMALTIGSRLTQEWWTLARIEAGRSSTGRMHFPKPSDRTKR